MTIDAKADAAQHEEQPDAGYAWMSDGSMPRTREDLIAEAVALIALLFSLVIGFVIATLPVSANAATTAAPAAVASAPSRELAAFRAAGMESARGERGRAGVAWMPSGSLQHGGTDAVRFSVRVR